MLIHTQRVPYKGRTAEQDAVSYPESHTRARLPSRTLIHTQRVPQRAGLPRRMLFHTQRVPYKGRTDEQDADTYQRVPHKGRTAEQDAVSYPEYHTRARLPSRMLYHTQLSEPVYIGGLPSSLPTVTRSTMQLYCVSVNNSYIYIYKMLSFKSTLKDTTFTLLFNLVNF